MASPRPFFACALLLVAGCLKATPPDAPFMDAEFLPVPRAMGDHVLDLRFSEDEWDGAAAAEGTFSIQDGSPANGNYPFLVKLAYDQRALHMALRVQNGTPNPWSTPSGAYSDHVAVFFDTGKATSPTAPGYLVFLGYTDGFGSSTKGGYWNGRDWQLTPDPPPSDFNDGRAITGTWGRGWADADGLAWELFVPLESDDPARNGLHLGPGSEVRVAFLFMRFGGNEAGAKSPDARGILQAPHDVWPGPGYTPHASYDPSGWLTLRLTEE